MAGEPPRPRKRTRKALDRKKVLVDKYIAEGLSEADAEDRARREMRDADPKRDWRRG
jgi:hypothetical protein